MAVTGALLLLLNLVAFAAFSWPVLTRVRRAESRALEVSARRANLETLSAQIEARKKTVERNRADIESLTRNYLEERAAGLFAAQREVESLARESGLLPSSSAYSVNEIDGTDLVRCEITLPLEGSYANLTGFLSRLETGPRFIVVDQLTLAEDKKGARMSLRLSVIFKEGDRRESH